MSITQGGQTIATFVYDGEGQRAKKTEGGETVVYVGKHYQKNTTTGVSTLFYYLGGRLVAQKKGADLAWVSQDHLAGTALVTDGGGNQVGATMSYYPFGAARSGSVPTDRKFTGQPLDQTGLYYYGARMYDPEIGRFISADTIVPQPANPQAFNRYSYVLNNPLRYIDPTGHFRQPPMITSGVCTSLDCEGVGSDSGSGSGTQSSGAVSGVTPGSSQSVLEFKPTPDPLPAATQSQESSSSAGPVPPNPTPTPPEPSFPNSLEDTGVGAMGEASRDPSLKLFDGKKGHVDVNASFMPYNAGLQYNPEKGLFVYFGLYLGFPGVSATWSPAEVSEGMFSAGSAFAGVGASGGTYWDVNPWRLTEQFWEVGVGTPGAGVQVINLIFKVPYK